MAREIPHQLVVKGALLKHTYGIDFGFSFNRKRCTSVLFPYLNLKNYPGT
jgi:hypothetical protein